MDCAEFLKKASMSRVSDITLKQPPIKNIYAPKEPLKPFVPKELRPSPGQKLKEVPPRQMFCSRCKYEFTVKAAVKVCPYCGRDDKLVRKS
ncbi:hypothetical protein COV20_02030 [Candidatus Woesearchaeota archaeon CG10_big_fil_rev_8_21_14_0_10_45_16]|nr:MAG: hypothetical protein COV20_02030 [Candidatus Woesearchaeota archaeon CG10_big_fil_rev_8_21_14_0_10_45_16]